MKKENQSAKAKKHGGWYGLLGGTTLIIVLAITLIVLAVNGAFANKTPVASVDVNSTDTGDISDSTPSDGEQDSEPDPQPTASFVNPLDTMTVLTDNGFVYDKTLDRYYIHTGIDVSAEEGSNVYAVMDGTVKAVFHDDVLLGGEIVLECDNGMTAVYHFIAPVETLCAGDSVRQGQTIATVLKATGIENKEGSHLHLEMYAGDLAVDPADYLILDEK